MKRLLAEFFGTWILMFVGIGTAMYDGHSIGHLGIALAFGLTLVALVYAIGPISGCHLNPAVTIGLATAGRFGWFGGFNAIGYIIAQVLGGLCGFGTLVWVLYLSGKYDPSMAAGVANGFGAHSALGVGATGAFVVEAMVTFILVLTVLGATADNASSGNAGIAIGLALAVGNFVAIPVTNASINPARSIPPALYAHGDALSQLWLFILAPIAGAIIAAIAYRWLSRR